MLLNDIPKFITSRPRIQKVKVTMSVSDDSAVNAHVDFLREDVKYAQEHDLQTLSIFNTRHSKDDRPLTGASGEPSTTSSKIWVM